MGWLKSLFSGRPTARRSRTAAQPRRRSGRGPRGKSAPLTFEFLEERTVLSHALSTQALDLLPISSTTGEKPQSKVWRHDDTWWSVLPNSSGTYVWELNGTTWTQGLKISSSTGAKADTKAVGDVTHVLLYRGTTSDLVSLEYVGGSYQLWSARPTVSKVSLTSGVETATIDIDSTGRMWLASDGTNTVEVRYSDYPYSTWSAPIVLASNISSDDIAAVTALPNGTVGVIWSNQTTQRFGFRAHVDGADPADWSADEVPASQSALPIGGGMADDHLNFAVAPDSTLYAAVKTSYDTNGYPAIGLLVRRPTGAWDSLYEVDPAGTRGIVVLDESAGKLQVVYTSSDSGGSIVYKETDASAIQFGAAQTLISGTNNQVSSTKQNFTDELVLLATSSGNAVGRLLTFAAPDQPPIVYAGPDQSLMGSSDATLGGSVTEGQPNPPGAVATAWSKVSGPGTVTFDDASAADTVAHFTAAGQYVLRLTGTDGGRSSSDDVRVTVASVSATTVSFQDGVFPTAAYAGTRDTKIKGGSPNSTYGSSTTLELDGAPDESTLLKWDISSIPAGSAVQAVSISFNVTATTVDSYEIYELKQNWVESTTTWNICSTGNNWQIAGAQGASDRGSTVLGSISAASTGLATIQLNAAGIAVVQSWIDNPAANYGIILQDYIAATDNFDASSSESGTAGNRPKLTISYTAGSNQPPTISDIADQSSDEDTATAAIAFTVGDVEIPPASLTVTGSSSNAALVLNANIVFGGSGANRTVSVNPAADQSGSATITITVSDGLATTSDTFVLTVNAVNDLPAISDITDVSIDEDTDTGVITFIVSDAETASANLIVAASSSDTSLVPDANIVLGASGSYRTVAVTPAANQFGVVTITITVSDGLATAGDTLVLTVHPVNDPPTVSDIADRSTDKNMATPAIAFTVGDAETAAADLTVSGTTSDPTLVPDANIGFGGSGADRTVTVTPAANQSGSVMITVTVSDGSSTAADSFVLTINVVNELPTVSDIIDQPTDEDVATAAIAFTVGDLETAAADLTVAGSSSDTSLVPNANIVFGGSGADRAVTVTPAADQFGSATITVTVSDGTATTSDTFVVTVGAVNDAPSFTKGPSQSVPQDSGPQTVLGWATGISAGPSNESGQTLSFAVSNDNNSLFQDQPAVSPDGTLSYRSSAGASGSATVTVTLSDDGGTGSGGSDSSAAQSFTITVTPVATPVTDSFQDGLFPAASYSGTRDTKIRSTFPTTNYGTGTRLQIDGSPDYATLMKWDISTIPVGSTVQSVAITITVIDASPHTYELYELKKDWSEGGATWVNFATGQSWEVAGAQGPNDRGSIVLGSVTTTLLGATTIELNAAGLAVVQSWVNNPSTNLGFIFQDYIDASDALDFNSREVATPAQRPKLSVTYLPNQTPTAEAGGPYSGDEGSDITLDASGSSDADGAIVLYEWDLDNDGQFDDAAGVTTAFHSTIDGTYTIGLRVTDDKGAKRSDAATVSVLNVAPTTEAGGPYSGSAGINITLDGAGSSDPGGDIVLYEWDLDGDGQFDDAAAVTADFNSALAGSFTVWLRVTDDDAATHTDSAIVNVL